MFTFYLVRRCCRSPRKVSREHVFLAAVLYLAGLYSLKPNISLSNIRRKVSYILHCLLENTMLVLIGQCSRFCHRKSSVSSVAEPAICAYSFGWTMRSEGPRNACLLQRCICSLYSLLFSVRRLVFLSFWAGKIAVLLSKYLTELFVKFYHKHAPRNVGNNSKGWAGIVNDLKFQSTKSCSETRMLPSD